ncbi:hypothetical protein HAX54_027482 [Datura stramonium]|uniref:Uncharacterized protein n=1 Tax=Datura stramonium TaxID=4076 RepID=A0ABS8V2F5_DATST|nr:hypothetical protein [Datura stramonium]
MANVVVVCVIILLSTFLIPPAAIANPRTELVYKFCGVERADNVSQFNQNYANAVAAMESEMRSNKFSIYGVSGFPNQIYVLAQCMTILRKIASFVSLPSKPSCPVAFHISGQGCGYPSCQGCGKHGPVHGGYAEGRRKSICSAVLECLPSIEARSLSVGCYFRYSEYESSDGSSFLFDTKDPKKKEELDWKKRLRIIEGTAEDFGLARLVTKEKRASRIIDPSMKIESVDEVLRVVQIALLCTQESPMRPDMTTVIVKLLTQEKIRSALFRQSLLSLRIRLMVLNAVDLFIGIILCIIS